MSQFHDSQSHDVIVLGAGIVGASTALHLQRRGRQVSLIDRREPGRETSYGNAGVIEGGTYVPIAFPRDLKSILRFAGNRQPALHFHWTFLPRIAPWLLALMRSSSEEKLRRNGKAMMGLTAHAIDEHRKLLAEAGAEALLRDTGWLHVYRTKEGFERDRLERAMADELGFGYTVMDGGEARELEPHLAPVFDRALLWHDIASVSDPGAVAKAVAGLFTAAGGDLKRDCVRGLAPVEGGWDVVTETGTLRARDVVVSLGPWSMELLRPLGYRFPFAVKRGYHQHYQPSGNATLSRPVLDAAVGYVLAPMERGIRLTTGIEFAAPDAPPTPVQLDHAEPYARELLPLDDRVDAEPWMGRRPCFPDSLPMIGPASKHGNLWLNFGHAHVGLATGPVSGRLLAELVTGEPMVADPAPFSPARF